MDKNLAALLVEKYPKIFGVENFQFDCDNGWFNILDSLCSCVQNRIDRNEQARERYAKKVANGEEIPAWMTNEDPIPQVVVAQIKEKFGTLRFYYQGGDNKIAGMVCMAESLSERVCEVCGSPGEPRGGGWIKTLCEDHVK